jgi:hypothetical protein
MYANRSSENSSSKSMPESESWSGSNSECVDPMRKGKFNIPISHTKNAFSPELNS